MKKNLTLLCMIMVTPILTYAQSEELTYEDMRSELDGRMSLETKKKEAKAKVEIVYRIGRAYNAKHEEDPIVSADAKKIENDNGMPTWNVIFRTERGRICWVDGYSSYNYLKDESLFQCIDRFGQRNLSVTLKDLFQ